MKPKSTGFRFQTGSIKRDFGTGECVKGVCFDSKLVRLKAEQEYRQECHQQTFRFQTGSIKRQLTWGLRACRSRFDSKLVRLKVKRRVTLPVCLVSFDSKLVRLKGHFRPARNCYRLTVSIPNWFD